MEILADMLGREEIMKIKLWETDYPEWYAAAMRALEVFKARKPKKGKG